MKNPLYWFDSHCHLDRLPAGLPVAEALQHASAAGVRQIVVPGVCGTPGTFVHEEGPLILLAWGIHPGFLAETTVDFSEVEPWQKSGIRPVAIGECGLDRRLATAIDLQEKYFIWQLQLAQRHALPVIVHLVGHQQRALSLLRKHPPQAGFVMHAYSGSPEMAAGFVAAGGCISLSAASLRNPDKLKHLLSSLPLTALLLETDAPDMPLPSWPGVCNEPAALPVIAAAIGDICGVEVEKLAEIVYKNAARLFKP